MRTATALLTLFAVGCSGDGDPATPTDTGTAPIELDLEGEVYALEVDDLNVVDADPGLATLVKLFFTRTVLVGVHSVSDDALTLRLGFSEDGSSPPVQDACTQTLDLPAADRDSVTAFAVGPETTNFQGAEVTYSIDDLFLSATFSDTGASIEDVVMEGGIDLRQVEVLGFGTAVDLCEAMEELGLPCEACDDSEPFCVELRIDGLRAVRVGGTMEAIDSLDPVACPDTTTG